MIAGMAAPLHLPGMESALAGSTEGRDDPVRVPPPIPYQE